MASHCTALWATRGTRQPYLPLVQNVVTGPAVAGDGEVAGLGVQREQGEVHGAAESEGDPDAVQNIPIGEHSDVEVGLDDVVELGVLLISEERVRHPDLVPLGEGEVLDLAADVVEGESAQYSTVRYCHQYLSCPAGRNTAD